jgi:Domain of unknown function (DUF4386)
LDYQEDSQMNAHRRTAAIVGALYIIGTVAGVLSMLVMGGRLDAPDYLTVLAADPNPVKLAALLVLVMGLALAMVPVMMFPILKKQNEALAVGYVVFRGALETALYIAGAISWLLLIIVARQYADAAASADSQLSILGSLLLKAGDPITAVRDIVFSLGALTFYYLLYKAKLIPRWLSGWGIIGATGYLAAGVIAVFSTELVILLLPIGLQEMVMAVWLIAKGFNTGAIAMLAPPRVAVTSGRS